MRRSLGPAVTLVVALLVALVFLVLAIAPPTLNDDPSSRAAGKAGTLALHNWLQSLGFFTHRITGDFDATGSDVVFIVDPTVAVGDAEVAALMRFLGSGGDLVLAVAPGRAHLAEALLAQLHVSLGVPRGEGDSAPAQPIDAGDRVHRVPMGPGSSIDAAPQLTPLLVQGGSVSAVAEMVPGGGRAYVLSSPLPLSNDGLRQADSSMLVLSLLTRARGGALAFDEYHHGEQNGAAGGASAIFGGSLGLTLGLAAMAVVGYLAISGRRLGRPLPSTDAGLVPSTASYVDAMAGLYARSRDRGAVATRYAEECKQRIGSVAGVDPGLGDEAFAAAAGECAHSPGVDLADVLRRARALARSAPDAGSLLALARDVDDLERSWAEPMVGATSAQ